MADVNGGVQAVRFSAKRGPFLGRQRHGPTIAGSTSRRGGTRLSVAAEKLEWIDRLAVQYLPSAGQRITWKCRCGVFFGAFPVVPTKPSVSPFEIDFPVTIASLYRSI